MMEPERGSVPLRLMNVPVVGGTEVLRLQVPQSQRKIYPDGAS